MCENQGPCAGNSQCLFGIVGVRGGKGSTYQYDQLSIFLNIVKIIRMQGICSRTTK